MDATPDIARQFQQIIAEKYPHFLGSKTGWEVRSLEHRMGEPGQIGYKEALLNDKDFNNQNTDSNSLGMVEITKNSEPVIRDLKNWDNKESTFLRDTLNNEISYFRSSEHFTTSRAAKGENPEIISVLRLLVKAFQYELKISKNAEKKLKDIIDRFNPSKLMNQVAQRKLQQTAQKLIMHAVNIEYAMNKLDSLGLRQKLTQMGDKNDQGSFAWWLNKEPLRSKEVGQGAGKTAKELGVDIVAHETSDFLAYESITRSHSGEPNVLISRKNAVGEAAFHGDGFYTQIGKAGAKGTGLTIRFNVDPMAREGTEFIQNGNLVIFHNKKALRVIQESLNFGINDLINLAGTSKDFQVDKTDLALLEKLRRRLNVSRINEELEKLMNSKSANDYKKLIHVLRAFQDSSVSKLLSEETIKSVSRNVYSKVEPLKDSPDSAGVLKFIEVVGPILKILDTNSILSRNEFLTLLERVVTSSSSSAQLKEQAIFEIILNAENLQSYSYLKSQFEGVRNQIMGWHRSSDARKRSFALELSNKWSKSIEKGDRSKLQDLTQTGLISINYRNESDVSAMQLAAYYKQSELIDWLTQNRDFDLSVKNKLGFNEIEQLMLSGEVEIANAIGRARLDIQVRPIEIKERNANQKTEDYSEGTPIIDFVRIEPGSFKMGEKDLSVFTTISNPFEFMSTHITKDTYKQIAELIANQNIQNNGRQIEYKDLMKGITSTSKDENLPIADVSFIDVSLWIKGLNELSQKGDPLIQQTLETYFPGHKKGKVYDLPTEAQWDFVVQKGGVAKGKYSFGNKESDSSQYAVYESNAPEPVGSKKPVFYMGKPIYDINGNMGVWVKDWHQSQLSGGVDPQGPKGGSARVIRGGSWNNFARHVRSANRNGGGPEYRYNNLGFRLVRTAH